MRGLIALIACVGVEVALFVALGPVLGVTGTLAELALSALLGIFTLRLLGQEAMAALSAAAQQRSSLAGPLADAALKALGALLLILPGFATDGLGLALLLPVVRTIAVHRVMQAAVKRGAQGERVYRTGARREGDSVILDGDYVDLGNDPPKGPNTPPANLPNPPTRD
jgi:UPF0716 protein FxsA